MEKITDKAVRIAMCLYLTILPWFVLPYNAYYTDDEKLLFPSGMEGAYDIFLYGKMLLTIIAAGIVLILLLINIFKYGYKLFDFNIMHDRVICICIVIYIVCTCVSYICSQYKQLALTGGANSFEGTIVLLAYVVLFFGGRYFVEKNDIHVLEYITMFHAVILFILTIIEVNYKDIAEIVIGHAVESDYPGMLCLTFYNPAYCAGFIIILFSLCIYYFYKADVLIRGIVWGILSSVVFISGILTKSSAAFYILMFELAAYIVIAIVSCIARRKNTQSADSSKSNGINILKISGIVAVIGVIVMFDMLSGVYGGNITSKARAASVNETTAVHKKEYYKVTDICIVDHEVHIISDKTLLVCGIDSNNRIYFKDGNDDIIRISSQDGKITFPSPYSMIHATIQNDTLCLDLGYKGELRFLMYDDDFYPVLSDGSVVKDISSQSQEKISKYDSLFTGRGYIWRNTVPLLKNTLVFGHGAGTFEMYFKQFDYVGLLNSQGNVDLIIDKPHSLYLQIACNQGVLCCLAVIALIGLLIVNNIKIVIGKTDCGIDASRNAEKSADKNSAKSKNSNMTINEIAMGRITALFAVVLLISFAVFELITDSSLTVNPLFIVIAGMNTAGWTHEKQ